MTPCPEIGGVLYVSHEAERMIMNACGRMKP
jgi:hypothetical protein